MGRKAEDPVKRIARMIRDLPPEKRNALDVALELMDELSDAPAISAPRRKVSAKPKPAPEPSNG